MDVQKSHAHIVIHTLISVFCSSAENVTCMCNSDEFLFLKIESWVPTEIENFSVYSGVLGFNNPNVNLVHVCVDFD